MFYAAHIVFLDSPFEVTFTGNRRVPAVGRGGVPLRRRTQARPLPGGADATALTDGVELTSLDLEVDKEDGIRALFDPSNFVHVLLDW